MAPDYRTEFSAANARRLSVLSPNVLELALIQSKPPDPARLERWDFVGSDGKLRPPEPAEFMVSADGHKIAVRAVGFKRRVAAAPLRRRDLRVVSELYLRLTEPIADGALVIVQNPDETLWPRAWTWSERADPGRLSTAIHVNQVGYVPSQSKTAMVGAYLGSLGELDVDANRGFEILDARSDRTVYRGPLRPRPDAGFPYPAYQNVLEANFTDFRSPGEYRLSVPGLGASFPFSIGDGAPAAFARTCALGLYHQRCGASDAMPFTRFTHDTCHTAPALVPLPESDFAFTWKTVAAYASQINPDDPPQIAPALLGAAAQLYPFVHRGTIDVSGGHHDAGDYSKYTLNSAHLIHVLMFAVDSLPGVADLDNLGIPESGDGVSDVMEEAKWEADFLAKMQDDDGGFYFLVYPRDREYEGNVTPDHGDQQVVWPKNTAATAAAVAALAEAASSPRFRRQYPAQAASYLRKAALGWQFLDRAMAQHGKDGAYQKITHYGDTFTHDDELAWAACAMFLATGDQSFERMLESWLVPSNPATRRWGWWRLCEGYGNAIRDYAFAARSGRLPREALNTRYLIACEDEIAADADDVLRWTEQNAYGTAFPDVTKRFLSAGWYFSTDSAFDLAVALQLDYPRFNDPRPAYRTALLGNLNYAAGCNPVDVCYITGLGWKRPREIVSQYAENDGRSLPPDGLLVGNLQAGYGWVSQYGRELSEMSFPSDSDPKGPYPIYDRWSDTRNVVTESVVTNQGRALAVTSWLMAQSQLRNQPWAPREVARISATQMPHDGPIELSVTAFDGRLESIENASIVWEVVGQAHSASSGQTPYWGPKLTLDPAERLRRVEVEIEQPDGRREFGAIDLNF